MKILLEKFDTVTLKIYFIVVFIVLVRNYLNCRIVFLTEEWIGISVQIIRQHCFSQYHWTQFLHGRKMSNVVLEWNEMRMRVFNLNSFKGKNCFCNIISGGYKISQTGWGANPKWGGSVTLIIYSQKLYKIEKIGPRRGRVARVPIITLGSANDYFANH